MMEWTTVKPSQEGWYWMRLPHGVGFIVRIMLAGQGNRARWSVVEDGDLCDLDTYVLDYEWSSKPIAEPKEMDRR
jgi:hypothetical protein